MYGLYILFYIQILSFYCWPAQSETEAIPISDADYAIQFHEYAMKLIFENENYQDALHYFRAAVRMKPKESLYLNDLGVTEMRMGLYEKAYSRFKAALKIDPNYVDVLDNVEVLSQYYDFNEYHDSTLRIQKHTIRNIPEIQVEDLLRECSSRNFAKDANAGVDDATVKVELDSSGNGDPVGADPDSEALCVDANKLLKQPFVIRNAALGMGWNISNFDITKLLLRNSVGQASAGADKGVRHWEGGDWDFGSARVDFYPHNMVDIRDTQPYFDTMDNVLRQLLRMFDETVAQAGETEALIGVHVPEVYHEVDASQSGTCVQWNMENNQWDSFITNILQPLHAADGGYGLPPKLFDEHWFDCLDPSGVDDSSTGAHTKGRVEDGEPFASKDTRDIFNLFTHWKMLLIGEEDAGMFNHKDTLGAPAWQVQLTGQKTWHICSPDQDEFMYEAGEVDTFSPNYKKYPLFLQAKCYQSTLLPGDMIYYPEQYWHQTRNERTPTVSIGATVITPSAYETLFAELLKECDGSNRIFPVHKRLCNKIQTCGAYWNSFFQGV